VSRRTSRFQYVLALILMLPALPTPPAQTQNPDEIVAAARQTASERGPQAALPELERALALYREKHDRRGEAITLGVMGNCYEDLADYPRALEYLGQSLEMKRRLGDRLEEGKTLSNLGLVYWDMADFPKAVDYYNRSLAIAREIKDKKLEATVLNNLGLVYNGQGEYPRSLEYYQQALPIHRAIQFESGESDTLGNIGGVYLDLGRYREALTYYQQALEMDQRLKLKRSQSLDLGNLALCETSLGQLQEAVKTYDRALALAREGGFKKDEADWHKGKGAAYVQLGKYDLARAEYRQALEVYEQAGLKRELIEALNDDGNLLAVLGDSVSAEKRFRRAIELSRSIGHPRGVTSNLMSLGDLEWRRQRTEQAGALYREAFERAREADDKSSMGNSLVMSALALRDQGRLGEASAEAQQGFEIARATGATLLEAQALYVLGELARRGREPEKALEHYAAGEKISRAASHPELTWQLAYGRGQALETLGRNGDALAAYRAAVETIEGVRSQLREERFQAGYLEDKSQVYVALVRLLLKMGQTSQAFEVSEKLRARAYLDLLDRNRAPVSSKAESDLRARIRRLQRAIEQETAKPKPQQRGEALSVLSSELTAAEREYQALIDDLRRSQSEYAALRTLAVPSPEQLQPVLSPDSALLEYVVGNDSVNIFLLTRANLRAKTVPVRDADLHARIELFRELISGDRPTGWIKPAQGLDRLLIQPIEEAGWLEGISRLYLVPHSVLHYLPFAALLRPNAKSTHFLVQDYVLAYLPAASALVYAQKSVDPTGNLFALAPVRSRLRYAQEEARSVGAFFPNDSLVLDGARATESAFKRQADSFKTVHLATHAFFDKLNPMFSGVELEPDAENDGRLEVHEILQLRLKARLVTLSACETALGSGYFSEYPPGDDFVGLTRAFLYAGSSEVLASLWEVNDRSTLRFMKAFYGSLERSDDAVALRKAQLALLASGGPYAQPYYWAPFVLVGQKK